MPQISAEEQNGSEPAQKNFVSALHSLGKWGRGRTTIRVNILRILIFVGLFTLFDVVWIFTESITDDRLYRANPFQIFVNNLFGLAGVLIVLWLVTLRRPHSIFLRPFVYTYKLSKSFEDRVADVVNLRSKIELEERRGFSVLLVIDSIDRRLERIRFRTGATMLTIALALICAVGVVLYAGVLTSNDATAVSSIDKIRSELSDASNQSQVYHRLSALYQQIDASEKIPMKDDDTKKRITALKSQYTILTTEVYF